MGSFPALPSGSNPYVGAAAGAAGAAASVYNNAQSRKALAAQRAAQAAEKQKTDAALAAQRAQASSEEQFKNEQALRAQGAIPRYLKQDATPQDPNLPPDEDTGPRIDPRTNGPGNFVTEPISKMDWYIPSESERNLSKLDDTNSFVLSDELAKEANKAGLSNVRAGTRYPRVDLGSLNQSIADYHKRVDAPKETGRINHSDYVDENGQPVSVFEGDLGNVRRANIQQPSNLAASLGQAAGVGGTASPQPGVAPTGGGTPGGPFDLSRSMQQFPFAASAQGAPAQPSQQPAQPAAARPAGGIAFRGKPDKPDKYTYNHFTNDAGAVSVTRIGPDDATPEIWKGGKWTALGDAEAIGPKRRDPDAAPRQKPMTAATGRAIRNEKDVEEKRLAGEWKKAVKAATSGDEIAQANEDLKNGYRANQLKFEKNIREGTGNDIEPSNWVDQFEPDPRKVPGMSDSPIVKEWQDAQAPAQPTQRNAAPPAATPQNAAPAVQEGTVIVNPKTKQRMTLKGGQWQPLPAR